MPDADALVELVLHLHAAPTEDELLLRLVTSVLDVVPTASTSALVLLGPRGSRPGPAAGTPALDPARVLGLVVPLVHLEVATVRVDDLRTDARWTRPGADDPQDGLRSVVVVPVRTQLLALGALVLGSAVPGAFEDGALLTARAAAAHAGVLLHLRRQTENLQTAVASRDVIGQAKGILMERLKLPADDAFRRLVGASQRTNRKVSEVAEELATTGVLRGDA